MGRGSGLHRLRTLREHHSWGLNTALSSPWKPLGLISWLILLVARAKESLWGFRLGGDRIFSPEHEALAKITPCLLLGQMGSSQTHPHQLCFTKSPEPLALHILRMCICGLSHCISQPIGRPGGGENRIGRIRRMEGNLDTLSLQIRKLRPREVT